MLILLPRVFAQPRPIAVISRIEIPQCSGLRARRGMVSFRVAVGSEAPPTRSFSLEPRCAVIVCRGTAKWSVLPFPGQPTRRKQIGHCIGPPLPPRSAGGCGEIGPSVQPTTARPGYGRQTSCRAPVDSDRPDHRAAPASPDQPLKGAQPRTTHCRKRPPDRVARL